MSTKTKAPKLTWRREKRDAWRIFRDGSRAWYAFLGNERNVGQVIPRGTLWVFEIFGSDTLRGQAPDTEYQTDREAKRALRDALHREQEFMASAEGKAYQEQIRLRRVAQRFRDFEALTLEELRVICPVFAAAASRKQR